MAYNTKKMLTDADGKLIPQIYDPTTDEYKPLSTDVYNNINVNNFPTEQSVTGNVNIDNFPATQQVEGNVQLTGSYAILAGETKPAGQQNETLIEYDESTGESIVYKYISGAWREL